MYELGTCYGHHLRHARDVVAWVRESDMVRAVHDVQVRARRRRRCQR